MTTPAKAIELYLNLRDVLLKELTAEYTLRKNEIEDAMQALEGFLLLTMQERNETQIKTVFGVAFRSPQMRVKLVDRDAFLDYCVANHDYTMITNHVSKDSARYLLDKGEDLTYAGIEVTEYITCNVRKA